MQEKMWRDTPPRTTDPLRFILFASRPYRTYAIFATIAVIIAASLGALTSYVYKLIVNAVTSFAAGGDTNQLWQVAILYIAISLLSELAWRSSGFIGMRWSTGVRATARYALTAYVTKHSHQYFSERFGGSISSKISHVANSSRGLVDNFIWQIVGFVVTIIASFTIAFLTSPTLGWVFVAWVVLVVPMNVLMVRKRVPLSAATQKAETQLNGATVDMLTNMNAVHEYARRSYELTRLRDLVLHRRVTGIRNWSYGEMTLLVNTVFQDIFAAGIVLGAVYYVTTGALSAGDMVLLLTLVLMMKDRLLFIGGQLNGMSESWGEISEGLTDIFIPREVADPTDAKTLSAPHGAIELEDVIFRYDGKTVFENLDLTIPAGQRVGLVGRSGAGKSTLMKILLRHYDIDGGVIRVDGTDISQVTKDSLREAIAVVPQEPLLFHRSIRENIRYGNPEAEDADVFEAARRAQAHDFIEQLPEGYEALVGERGVKLSGGQRQRIAIARAFLKQSPIVLLDEATSALDSESEVMVQKALFELMEGKTVVAIAHRLSTLRAMDRILVMDNGAIVEDGSHEELLEKNGSYAELWNHQAGGFLGDTEGAEV